MNRGFIDGNKRVGFAATYVFLRCNGLDITANAETTLDSSLVISKRVASPRTCWSSG